VIAGLAAAALAAALYVLAFPPADAGILAFVALAPWCWIARRFGGGRLLALSALAGAAILAIGCSWIGRTAAVNLILMVVPESAAFALFAWLLRRLLVVREWRAIAALPVAFTAIEVARGRWPLDGFPWLTLGYTQHGWLDLVQMSAVTGVHGVTFLLATTAGAVADVVHAPGRRGGWAALAASAGLVAALAAGGRLAAGDPGSLPAGPRLLLVQPAIPQSLKDSSARTSSEQLLRRHFELTESALAGEARPVDLAVWSETMLPAPWPAEGDAAPDDPEAILDLRRWTRETLVARWFAPRRRPLLVGVLTYRGSLRDPFVATLNSAILFDAKGERVATYDKTVLVPGGEYLPWIDWFPDTIADAIRRRVLDLAGFLPNLAAGTRSGVVDLESVGVRGRAGLTICFEIAYPHLGRRLVKDGADLLVNLSNEAWFPDSAEFDQYTAMAVFRAAETRRSLVRCANSGTSGWIDPWGRRHLLTDGGRRHGFAGTALVEPPRCSATTLYARFGEWVGAAAWIVLLAGVAPRRRHPRAAPA